MITSKSVALVAVLVSTVTVIFPVVELLGTTTESELSDAVVTVATTLLNLTAFKFATGEKLEPEIVTVAPGSALTGAKEINVGSEIVKSFEEVTVVPLVVIEIFPVAAPAGTAT